MPSSLLQRIVERIIQKLKRDQAYRLDTAVNGRILFQVIWQRILAQLRGLYHQLWLQQSGGNFFLGRAVHLRHPQLIRIGQAVIIEDNVTIDALSVNGISLGNNVTIAKFTTIQCTGVIRNLGQGLQIGDNSAVGAYSFIGAQGGIKIGSNVIIGPRVSFHAENHLYSDPNTPIRLQGESRQGIIVEDDCWIGAGSIILDGVHISQGSIIAAGSVVTKNIPPHSVMAGVPARLIKNRSEATSE